MSEEKVFYDSLEEDEKIQLFESTNPSCSTTNIKTKVDTDVQKKTPTWTPSSVCLQDPDLKDLEDESTLSLDASNVRMKKMKSKKHQVVSTLLPSLTTSCFSFDTVAEEASNNEIGSEDITKLVPLYSGEQIKCKMDLTKQPKSYTRKVKSVKSAGKKFAKENSYLSMYYAKMGKTGGEKRCVEKATMEENSIKCDVVSSTVITHCVSLEDAYEDAFSHSSSESER